MLDQSTRTAILKLRQLLLRDLLTLTIDFCLQTHLTFFPLTNIDIICRYLIEFFLIVDELHAYRGTPGTEVAYLVRL